MVKNRVFGLDFIRFLAILFVPSVHYYMYNGFYVLDSYNNISYIFPLFFRNLFYICVPLFLLLTGYLTQKPKINRDYFYKFFRVFISYLIIAIIVFLFRIFYMDFHAGKAEIIYGFLSFEINPYAWYVEMYLGLFLLIPFLNIIYENINKFQKKLLIIILLLVTAVAPITNNVPIHGTVTNIFPDWWTTIYPITYFFIGKYLAEFPIKFSNIKKIIIAFAALAVHTFLMFLFCMKGSFNWGIFSGYNNLFTVILAVMVFEIFINLNLKNKFVHNTITIISKVSFEIYLISYIFDNLFYSLLKLNYENTLSYFINYFIIVPLVFIGSFVCGYVINKLVSILFVKIRPFYDRIINTCEKFKLHKI